MDYFRALTLQFNKVYYKKKKKTIIVTRQHRVRYAKHSALPYLQLSGLNLLNLTLLAYQLSSPCVRRITWDLTFEEHYDIGFRGTAFRVIKFRSKFKRSNIHSPASSKDSAMSMSLKEWPLVISYVAHMTC